jgi:hypothetical protein
LHEFIPQTGNARSKTLDKEASGNIALTKSASESSLPK